MFGQDLRWSEVRAHAIPRPRVPRTAQYVVKRPIGALVWDWLGEKEPGQVARVGFEAEQCLHLGGLATARETQLRQVDECPSSLRQLPGLATNLPEFSKAFL